MRLEADAKVNIGLLVGEKRRDGFHDIETIMARISLSDTIDAEVERAGSCFVSINGNDSYLSGGKDLMEKSAEIFFEKTGIGFSLHISIEKHIPAMSGFGGGSSDAAAILSFLNDSFGKPLDRSAIMECAALVGSDVPFFASGFSGALVTGRGEIVEECYVPHGKKIFLFIPDYAVSTKAAYSLLDSFRREKRHLRSLKQFFPSRGSHPNDFEMVIDTKNAIDVFRALFPLNAYVSMTGSGSAWFSILPEESVLKFDNLEKYGIVSAYII